MTVYQEVVSKINVYAWEKDYLLIAYDDTIFVFERKRKFRTL